MVTGWLQFRAAGSRGRHGRASRESGGERGADRRARLAAVPCIRPVTTYCPCIVWIVRKIPIGRDGLGDFERRVLTAILHLHGQVYESECKISSRKTLLNVPVPPPFGELLIYPFVVPDRQEDRLADFAERLRSVWVPRFGNRLWQCVHIIQVLRSMAAVPRIAAAFATSDPIWDPWHVAAPTGSKYRGFARLSGAVAGGPGFEPRLPGSEPGVLPLNYPPTAERAR